MKMSKEDQIKQIKQDIAKLKKIGYGVLHHYTKGHPIVICQDWAEENLYYAIAYRGQYDGYDQHLMVYASCRIEGEWVNHDGWKRIEPKN